MKAMVLREHGGPEVLHPEDCAEPEVGEHDLLVEVHATSVNPVDTKVRRAASVPRPYPLILGYDVSGVVVGLGASVAGFARGDEVYAAPNLFRPGANAERVAVDARSAARKPASVDHATAAVVPLVGLTAWRALHGRARLQAGQTVLIHAGGGGVGHVAIQLAKLFGARVITTASGEGSTALCRTLGADEVINHRREDFVQRTLELTGGQGAPVILDLVGGEVPGRSVDCLATYGQLVTILGAETEGAGQKLLYKGATVHYEFMGIPTWRGIEPESQGAVLRNLADLLDRGRLRPHVAHRLPLSELGQAHRLQETGHTVGKIAIIVR
jgi:NADPH2:quinone reductase